MRTLFLGILACTLTGGVGALPTPSAFPECIVSLSVWECSQGRDFLNALEAAFAKREPPRDVSFLRKVESVSIALRADEANRIDGFVAYIEGSFDASALKRRLALLADDDSLFFSVVTPSMLRVATVPEGGAGLSATSPAAALLVPGGAFSRAAVEPVISVIQYGFTKIFPMALLMFPQKEFSVSLKSVSLEANEAAGPVLKQTILFSLTSEEAAESLADLLLGYRALLRTVFSNPMVSPEMRSAVEAIRIRQEGASCGVNFSLTPDCVVAVYEAFLAGDLSENSQKMAPEARRKLLLALLPRPIPPPGPEVEEEIDWPEDPFAEM